MYLCNRKERLTKKELMNFFVEQMAIEEALSNTEDKEKAAFHNGRLDAYQTAANGLLRLVKL